MTPTTLIQLQDAAAVNGLPDPWLHVWYPAVPPGDVVRCCGGIVPLCTAWERGVIGLSVEAARIAFGRCMACGRYWYAEAPDRPMAMARRLAWRVMGM